MSRTSGLIAVAIIYYCWDTEMEKAEQEPESKPMTVSTEAAEPAL